MDIDETVGLGPYSTSIPNGGLGLSPYQIGVILGAYGVCNAILQLYVWKPILKRIGPRKMFLLSYSFHITRVVLMMFARMAAARAGEVDAVVWGWVILQMGSSTLAATAYSMYSYLSVYNFIFCMLRALTNRVTPQTRYQL